MALDTVEPVTTEGQESPVSVVDAAKAIITNARRNRVPLSDDQAYELQAHIRTVYCAVMKRGHLPTERELNVMTLGEELLQRRTSVMAFDDEL